MTTSLAIDWKALGIDPTTASITAEPIVGFQAARSLAPGESIPVPRGKGWLLTIAAR